MSKKIKKVVKPLILLTIASVYFTSIYINLSETVTEIVIKNIIKLFV